MTLELINPQDLTTPASYTQVIAATGSRLVFVAGQLADDAEGNIVGPGDLAAQARQAFANVGRVGGGWSETGPGAQDHDLCRTSPARVPGCNLAGSDIGIW